MSKFDKIFKKTTGCTFEEARRLDPKTLKQRKKAEKVVKDALEYFWIKVADAFPEIQTGDMSPEDTMRELDFMTNQVLLWYDGNLTIESEHDETIEEAKAKILKVYKTPLDVYNGGKKTDDVYYAAVKEGTSKWDKGEAVFILVKDPRKPADTQVSGGWLVKSLLYSNRPIGNALYIDAGQEWGVTGLNKIKKDLMKDFPKGDYEDPLDKAFKNMKLDEGKTKTLDKFVDTLGLGDAREEFESGTYGAIKWEDMDEFLSRFSKKDLKELADQLEWDATLNPATSKLVMKYVKSMDDEHLIGGMLSFFADMLI